MRDRRIAARGPNRRLRVSVRMAEPDQRPAPPPPRQRQKPLRRPGQRGARPETRGPAAPVSPSLPGPAGRRRWRDIPAPLRWLAATIVLLAAAVAIFLWLFRWNWLRGPIDDYASQRLHRQVAIHGDLSARIWSWTPS